MRPSGHHASMKSLFFLLLLFLQCATCPVYAQTSAGAEVSSASPALREARVAEGAFMRGVPLPAWAQPPADIPATARTAPIVVRLAETQFYAGDKPGFLVQRAIQVNNMSALGQVGQYPLHFVPQYQQIQLHGLRILRGGEVLDRMGQVNVRFLERETGLESGIYSGTVTAMLLIEDVRVGDTLHLTYSVHGENPVFGGKYSQSASWDQADPVELRRVVMIHPARRPVAWRMHGDHRPVDLRPAERTAGDMRILQFDEGGMEGVEFEPYVPSDYFGYRWLQFTEFRSWAEVAQWAAGLFAPVSALPTEVQALVARLRALPSEDERVSQALQWVQDEIRYFSVSLGESSHRPYPPDQVLQRRYGDCKDKTYLLIVILRELGIEAKPVLVSQYSPRTAQRMLPNPDVFDHVMAQVTLNGRTFYLDGTRFAQRGSLARMGTTLVGARALVAAPETRELSVIAVENAAELAVNDLKEEFELPRFGGPGVLTVRQTWNGTSAEIIRFVHASSTPAQFSARMIEGYERRYPGIVLEGALDLQDDKARNVVTLAAKFSVPELAREVNGNWVMRFSVANLQGIFIVPPKINRQFPTQVSTVPYEARYALSVKWPENVSVIADPSTRRLRTNFFDAEVQRSFRGNVANLNLTFAARAETALPKELPSLLEDLRSLDRAVPGVVSVDKSAIKTVGFFGKTSVQQTVQARLDKQIEALSRTIRDGTLKGDDLAEALCDRAEALSDREKAAEGMIDAQEALKLAPALGRVWQCRGNMHFAQGEFVRAIPDYTRALGLGHSPFEVMFRRGLARFYAGEYDAATVDLAKAVEARQQADAADATYARLWFAWALQRAGKPLPQELTELAGKVRDRAWPSPALGMVAGLLTPEQLIEVVNKKQGDDRELTLAEAWFYVGQYHQNRGDLARAKEAYEKVRALQITMYIEHVAAGFELQRLK